MLSRAATNVERSRHVVKGTPCQASASGNRRDENALPLRPSLEHRRPLAIDKHASRLSVAPARLFVAGVQQIKCAFHGSVGKLIKGMQGCVHNDGRSVRPDAITSKLSEEPHVPHKETICSDHTRNEYADPRGRQHSQSKRARGSNRNKREGHDTRTDVSPRCGQSNESGTTTTSDQTRYADERRTSDSNHAHVEE